MEKGGIERLLRSDPHYEGLTSADGVVSDEIKEIYPGVLEVYAVVSHDGGAVFDYEETLSREVSCSSDYVMGQPVLCCGDFALIFPGID